MVMISIVWLGPEAFGHTCWIDYIWARRGSPCFRCNHASYGVKIMATIETTELVFSTKIGGVEFVIDYSKMHPTVVADHLLKAAQRYVNDSLGSTKDELPSVRADMARLAFAEVHSGNPLPVKERKASVTSAADPVRKMARDLATTFLVTQFKAAMPGDEKVWAKNPKTEKFFRATEKGHVRFDLGAVDEWMKAYAAKRDFVAEAKASLESVKEEVDLSDLGL